MDITIVIGKGENYGVILVKGTNQTKFEVKLAELIQLTGHMPYLAMATNIKIVLQHGLQTVEMNQVEKQNQEEQHAWMPSVVNHGTSTAPLEPTLTLSTALTPNNLQPLFSSNLKMHQKENESQQRKMVTD